MSNYIDFTVLIALLQLVSPKSIFLFIIKLDLEFFIALIKKFKTFFKFFYECGSFYFCEKFLCKKQFKNNFFKANKFLMKIHENMNVSDYNH